MYSGLNVWMQLDARIQFRFNCMEVVNTIFQVPVGRLLYFFDFFTEFIKKVFSIELPHILDAFQNRTEASELVAEIPSGVNFLISLNSLNPEFKEFKFFKFSKFSLNFLNYLISLNCELNVKIRGLENSFVSNPPPSSTRKCFVFLFIILAVV